MLPVAEATGEQPARTPAGQGGCLPAPQFRVLGSQLLVNMGGGLGIWLAGGGVRGKSSTRSLAAEKKVAKSLAEGLPRPPSQCRRCSRMARLAGKFPQLLRGPCWVKPPVSSSGFPGRRGPPRTVYHPARPGLRWGGLPPSSNSGAEL